MEYPGIGNPIEFKIDPFNRPWVIHSTECMLLDDNQWVRYSGNIPFPNVDARLSTIIFDDVGAAWIGTSAGLASFDGQKWTTYTSSNSGLKWDPISALSFDSKGRLWIGSWGKGGLTIYDGHEWRNYPQEGVFKKILIDGHGTAWIRGTFDHNLLTFYEGVWKYYDSTPNSVPLDFDFSLDADAQGRVWITTESGIWMVDGDTWISYNEKNISLEIDTDRVLKFDEKRSIRARVEGNKLAIFNGKNWTVYTYENSGLTPGPIDRNSYVDMKIAPDGMVWGSAVLGNGKEIFFSINIDQISEVKLSSPILVALRPFTFSPEARWALIFIIFMIWLGFVRRVEVPVIVTMTLVLMATLVWGNNLIFMWKRGINPYALSLVGGSIVAYLGGTIDLQKNRFGIKQRTGILWGIIASILLLFLSASMVVG